jgi:hypothetical protein
MARRSQADDILEVLKIIIWIIAGSMIAFILLKELFHLI